LKKKYFDYSPELLGQLEEKYFDYNGVTPDCPDNQEKIHRLHRRLRRQLWLVTLGGSPPHTRANYQQR
jgi:hypothetical protein